MLSSIFTNTKYPSVVAVRQAFVAFHHQAITKFSRNASVKHANAKSVKQTVKKFRLRCLAT